MCGIFGFEGETVNKTILREGLKKASQRGGHSFGFYGITKKGKHICFKSQGNPDFDFIINQLSECNVGIANFRLVTSADKSILNTQPVVRKNLIGVHNGNLTKEEQDELITGKCNTDLDSEILMLALQNGFEDLISSPYAVLVISFDMINHSLRAYTGGLPLHKKISNNTIYYCSKLWQKQEQ